MYIVLDNRAEQNRTNYLCIFVYLVNRGYVFGRIINVDNTLYTTSCLQSCLQNVYYTEPLNFSRNNAFDIRLILSLIEMAKISHNPTRNVSL